MPKVYDSIVSFDVGHKLTGWAFKDSVGEESGWFKTEGYVNFLNKTLEVLEKYNADLIICGKPNRYYNVIASHNKYIGILCLTAEKNAKSLIEINDMSARATVFPGKGGTKDKVKPFFPVDMSEDEMDAIIFVRAGWKMFNTLD
jgi:hypothetical protein